MSKIDGKVIINWELVKEMTERAKNRDRQRIERNKVKDKLKHAMFNCFRARLSECLLNAKTKLSIDRLLKLNETVLLMNG